MLIFRSEEHLDEWLADPARPRGEAMTTGQQWALAKAWFAGRHTPEWTKRTAAGAEEVFRSVGLTSDFWRLTE